MKSDAASWSSKTVVTEPMGELILFWAVFPLLGAGAGWLIKAAAGWVVSLPWAPFQGPFQLVERLIAVIGEPLAIIIALVVGVIVGLALAMIATHERLTVIIADEHVTLACGDSTREIRRATIGAVLMRLHLHNCPHRVAHALMRDRCRCSRQ
jgi:hypothetical protein